MKINHHSLLSENQNLDEFVFVVRIILAIIPSIVDYSLRVQSWTEFYAPLFAVAGLEIDAVPNISFDEFWRAYEPYRSSLLTKTRQMGLELLRPALSRGPCHYERCGM